MVRRALIPILILVLLVLAACGPGRDVHGSKRNLRVSEMGDEFFEDLDLRGETFATIVAKGGGTYETSSANADNFSDIDLARGVFIIPDVSEDLYFLLETQGNANRIFVSNSDDIDLSTVRLGRVYAATPTMETDLRLNITNLGEWHALDEIELVAPNIGGLLQLDRVAKTGTLAVGATAVEDLTIDFNALGLPLLDQTKLDHFWVTQLEDKAGDDIGYSALTRLYDAPRLTMTDGMTAESAGAFTDVAQDQNFRATVRGSEFAKLVPVVFNGAKLEGGQVEILSLIEALKHGYHSDAPRLAATYFTGGGQDFAFAVTYGDPFPPTWDDIIVYDYVYTVELAAAGATKTSTLGFAIGGVVSLDDARAAGTIEPRLTPVRNVQIGGLDATQDRDHVGSSPYFSWDPPEKGTANAYHLVFFVLVQTMTGETEVRQFFDVYTGINNFQVPTGFLDSGPRYHLEITAFDEPSRDPYRVPFREQLPAHHASMLTAAFTP